MSNFLIIQVMYPLLFCYFVIVAFLERVILCLYFVIVAFHERVILRLYFVVVAFLVGVIFVYIFALNNCLFVLCLLSCAFGLES